MHRHDQVSPFPPLTRVVKFIVITCVSVFFIQLLAGQFQWQFFGTDFPGFLGLVPRFVIERYWGWQFFTYMFLHGHELHLLLNMVILWLFGSEIEMRLGQRGFLTYFLLCGVGGGLINLAVTYFTHSAKMGNPIIGASAAIYGILVAYGILFGNRYMLVFFLFPIQAKYYALITAGLEFLFSIKANPQDNVAHVAHLGGMVVGAVYLYFKYIRTRGQRGKTKKEQEREKLKKQFTLIVNQAQGKDEEEKGPYWN